MQGFNMGRYHAPASLDPALSSTNGQPVAKRARISGNSTPAPPPTVRFEMPFAIWCSTCPAHAVSRLIGQGVRFNARKTRVGAYHSTPIWSFELKHTACGGRIEIRTDPVAHDFVVTEGARRRDTGDDALVAERTGGQLLDGGGMVKSREEQDRDRARQDAFEAFEGKKQKQEQTKGAAQRLEELQSVKERDWRDPDAANRRLRNNFRSIRRARDRDRERGETLAEIMGFGFELLEGSEADSQRAALVDFAEGDLSPEAAAHRVAAKPLFVASSTSTPSSTSSKGGGDGSGAVVVGGRRKGTVEELRRELVGNTRASLDPFGARRPPSDADARLHALLPGIRRKKLDPTNGHLSSNLSVVETSANSEPAPPIETSASRVPTPAIETSAGTIAAPEKKAEPPAPTTLTSTLVDYDSD